VGPLELAAIAVIALFVLGPERIPGAAKSLGAAFREFRQAIGGNERPVGSLAPGEQEGGDPLEVLRQAISHPSVRQAGAALDATIEFRVEGSEGSVIAEFRAGEAGHPEPDATVTIAPPVAGAFLAGTAHEPSLLASGEVAYLGPTGLALRSLPVLPVLSAARGTQAAAARTPHYAYVDDFRYDLAERVQAHLPPELGASARDRAGLALMILVGLPAGCRPIEVLELVRRSGERSPESLLELLRLATSVAVAEVAEPRALSMTE